MSRSSATMALSAGKRPAEAPAPPGRSPCSGGRLGAFGHRMISTRQTASSHPGVARKIVAVGLAASLLQACVSIRLETVPPGPARYETATLSVAVYETPADLRRGVVTHRAVLTELFILDEHGREHPLHWSSDASWWISAVAEGRYVLRVRTWLDAQGQRHPLGTKGELGFAVAPGGDVRLSVVMNTAADAARTIAVAAAAAGFLVLCLKYDSHCLEDLHRAGHPETGP